MSEEGELYKKVQEAFKAYSSSGINFVEARTNQVLDEVKQDFQKAKEKTIQNLAKIPQPTNAFEAMEYDRSLQTYQKMLNNELWKTVEKWFGGSE